MLEPIIIRCRLPNTDHMCIIELNTRNKGLDYLSEIEFYISHGNGHKELVFTLNTNTILDFTYKRNLLKIISISFIVNPINPNLLNLKIDEEWNDNKSVKRLAKYIHKLRL